MKYSQIALVAASLAPFTVAQTTSECDPTAGDKCDPDPAFGQCGKEQVYDFSTVSHGDGWKTDSGFLDLWKPDDGITGDNSPLSIGDNGATFTITQDDQAPLIKSKKYIFYGKIEVEVQAAPGQGIVTSVVLESDDRDEIDWEWVGNDQGNVQTNFYSKGVNDYTHGQTHAVGFNAMEGLHKYAVEWTKEYISFSVDGNEIRRATTAEVEGFAKWPQTPAMIKLGTWVGGKPGGAEGTIAWAGGLVQMDQAPFIGYYKSVKITDYCGFKDQAGEYTYGDATGNSDSIVVSGSSSDASYGDGNGSSSAADSSTSASKTPEPSTTLSTSVMPTASKTSSGSDSAKETSSSTSGSTSSGTGQQAEQSSSTASSAAAIIGSSSVAGLVFAAFLLFA